MESEKTPMTAERLASEFGITVTSVFVPFSQSRSFKPNPKFSDYNLNWKVTLVKDGREILTTDYMAGQGHCPSYKNKFPTPYDKRMAVVKECEKGQETRFLPSHGSVPTGKSIKPETANVLYSMILDSNVLDYARFEDWATDMGYDPDSRSGEKIYRACLEIALKLRNGLGDEMIKALAVAFEDY